MQKRIQLYNQELAYTLRRSKRARRISITIDFDSSVVVTLPWRTNILLAEEFVLQKAKWILRKIEQFHSLQGTVVPRYTYEDYLKNRDKAYEFAARKVEYFNETYQYRIHKINIKNQKTRWGSCSKKGNLNFNYKILFLPERTAEYIVVHEMCHLKELNHSRKFWDLVARTFPDHKEIRKELHR